MTNNPGEVASRIRELTTGKSEKKGQISTTVFGSKVTWFVIRRQRPYASKLGFWRFGPFYKNVIAVAVEDGSRRRINPDRWVSGISADMVVRVSMEAYRSYFNIGDAKTWSESFQESMEDMEKRRKKKSRSSSTSDDDPFEWVENPQ